MSCAYRNLLRVFVKGLCFFESSKKRVDSKGAAQLGFGLHLKSHEGVRMRNTLHVKLAINYVISLSRN